jgi:hypothetical protein
MAASRLLSARLYEISPLDPVVYASAMGLLIVTSISPCGSGATSGNGQWVTAEIEPQEYAATRWLGSVDGPPPPVGGANVMAVDSHGRRVILFTSKWELRCFERHHLNVLLFEESPELR